MSDAAFIGIAAEMAKQNFYITDMNPEIDYLPCIVKRVGRTDTEIDEAARGLKVAILLACSQSIDQPVDVRMRYKVVSDEEYDSAISNRINTLLHK
ncbi:MAG: hypothetical protein NC548_28640 [Lachnospiraceae bacterium]|nr:hypothetical protein [Lachnospiraceae bacterium]MCM1235536.1 hypothetical protein [Ruminococcus flavefaciens]